MKHAWFELAFIVIGVFMCIVGVAGLVTHIGDIHQENMKIEAQRTEYRDQQLNRIVELLEEREV